MYLGCGKFSVLRKAYKLASNLLLVYASMLNNKCYVSDPCYCLKLPMISETYMSYYVAIYHEAWIFVLKQELSM